MMKYMGSKNRHAKEILSIVLKDRSLGQYFVEPFCGGCNITDKVDGKRIANDIDFDLITMWKAVSSGWIPPEILTEEDYKKIKQSPISTPEKGYAAFALSYGGKKWGGWCRDRLGKRNYVSEAYRNALKQFPKLLGVDFRCGSYKDLSIPNDSIVYCDPPYMGTTSYTGNFNHDHFWDWVRDLSVKNKVYVSEYSAPRDFDCIWEKQVNSSLEKDTGSKKNIERLFIRKDTEQ